MGNYNVVDNYDWTLNKGVDIPYIKFRELEFKGSPVAEGYAHFLRFTLELPTVSKFVLVLFPHVLALAPVSMSSSLSLSEYVLAMF